MGRLGIAVQLRIKLTFSEYFRLTRKPRKVETMPLMTTKPMFDLAYEGGFAVGAFNVNNMELAQSIIDACAAEKSPLILQISKGARKYANIRYLKAIIDAGVADHPEIPIA